MYKMLFFLVSYHGLNMTILEAFACGTPVIASCLGAMAEMGKNARREYEDKYTPEKNYEMLMEIYQKALENKR